MRGVDLALEHGARVQRDREQGQANLFGEAVPSASSDAPGRRRARRSGRGPRWSGSPTRRRPSGLYLSGHPVDRHTRDDLRAFGARTVGDLLATEVPGRPRKAPRPPAARGRRGRRHRGAVRALKTKKGDPMAVLTLEDAQGSVEVVVFPETYGRFRHLIETGALLLVKGKFERDDDSSRFQANELSSLEGLRERMAKLGQHPPERRHASRSTLEALWDVLAQHQGDRPIVLETRSGARHAGCA